MCNCSHRIDNPETDKFSFSKAVVNVVNDRKVWHALNKLKVFQINYVLAAGYGIFRISVGNAAVLHRLQLDNTFTLPQQDKHSKKNNTTSAL